MKTTDQWEVFVSCRILLQKTQWSAHRHTSAKAQLPGSESRCELGPQRVIITVSINQLTNSSMACFIMTSSPFFLWQWQTVGGLMTWFYLFYLSFPDAFTERTTVYVKVCLSSTSHQSPSVELKWSPLTETEAAVSRLNRLRQFQGNNRLCQLESSGGGDSLVFLSGETQRA